MTVYEYGWAAWVWRALMVFFLALAAVFLLLVTRGGGWLPLAGAAALSLPALVFGLVVAVRVRKAADGWIDVQTLLFVRRRVHESRLGAPRVKVRYRSEFADHAAPRVWVPVKGSLPLYIDLLGTIPDKGALLAVLKLRADELRYAD